MEVTKTKELDTLVVVHFHAEWSEPSKQMQEVLKELSSLHASIKFLKVDVDKVPEAQTTYNIQAVPFILVFKDGSIADRLEGADPQSLVKKIDALSVATPDNEETSKTDLTKRIESIISSDKVVLFMKGSPDQPKCGFSNRVVQALKDEDIKFSHFDILTDESIRQGLKEYSCWPTYPQLYAGGELLGGCDIITDLKKEGKLKSEIEAKTVPVLDTQQRCKQLVHQAPVVLFMKGSPSEAKCKFSRRLVEILNEAKIEFAHVDVLEDESIRQGMKEFSEWPTFPQLYVSGEFIGGCDIVEVLHSKGELGSRVTSLLKTQS